MKQDDYQYIWIFMGHGGELPVGVFSTFEKAREWIEKHELHGHLAKYPIDTGVFDWAMALEYIKPGRTWGMNRQNFASSVLEHHHFEDLYYEDDTNEQ